MCKGTKILFSIKKPAQNDAEINSNIKPTILTDLFLAK